MMMSTILMLFGRYLMLTIVKLKSEDDIRKNLINRPPCEFQALFLQFTRISSMFWLNALGHAVWSSFRQLQAVSRQNKNTLGIFDKKYKWYALYAWGCPLLVTIVTVAIQHVKSNPYDDPAYNPENLNYYPPRIGEEQCRIHDGLAQLFYIHIINGPVLVSNDN